jgi:hypothetical protein
MRRVSAGTLLVPALLALAFALAAQWWAARARSEGNVLVFVNASSASVDSVAITAEPPFANPLAGRTGFVAAKDSAKVALGRDRGDATVRVYRRGKVLADRVVYFGGDSEFELWLSDEGSLGRYRRSGAGSGAGSGADSRGGSGGDAAADSSGAGSPRRSGT